MALSILVGFHILCGITAVLCGAAAMLAPKRAGRHPVFGRCYLAAVGGALVTGTSIAATDWTHLWHLAALGAVTFGCVSVGYAARRIRWKGWLPVHVLGMSGSYVAMLTAFYVDNGPRLPIWELLPPISFWFLPTLVAAPLVARALIRHSRARTDRT